MQEALDHNNIIIYAAKHYNNSACESDDEFFADLKRIKYIKRLFKKFEESGDLKERLILNHIIVLYNLFGNEPTTRLLFFKLKGHYDLLKPFLEFLGRLPPQVHSVGWPSKDINTSEIESSPVIIERLSQI